LFVLAANLLQTLLNRAKDLNLLNLPLPLVSSTNFPILQYADDTLIIMEGCARQLVFLKSLLQTLATSTGLKVNYSKSMMIPINIEDRKMSIPVGVLDRQTYQGGTRGSRLCGEDRDRETENSKVCTRTRDTRFIQVRTAKVASPTSCLGDQVWRPALGVGFRSGPRLGTRPSFI
jgi:hypothetical protein